MCCAHMFEGVWECDSFFCLAGLPLFGRLLLRGAVKWTLRCRAPVLLKSCLVQDSGRHWVEWYDRTQLKPRSGGLHRSMAPWTDASLVATCCLRHVKSLIFRFPAWGRHHATGMQWDGEGTLFEPMVSHTLQGKSGKYVDCTYCMDNFSSNYTFYPSHFSFPLQSSLSTLFLRFSFLWAPVSLTTSKLLFEWPFCKGPKRRCVVGVCYCKSLHKHIFMQIVCVQKCKSKSGEHEIHWSSLFLLAGPPSVTASLRHCISCQVRCCCLFPGCMVRDDQHENRCLDAGLFRHWEIKLSEIRTTCCI